MFHMTFNIRKILFTAVLLAVAGCNQEQPVAEEGTYNGGRLITKAVNTPYGSDDRSLLLYLANTDSGTDAMAELEEILHNIGAARIEKVFPAIPGKEEKAARYGLDKWYEVIFESSANVENAAEMLSASANVQRIQFNTKMKKASDCKSWPYVPSASLFSERNSAFPFNDPYIKNQWHYKNAGDKSIAPTARSGADVNVTDAWRLTGGDPSIIVAIIDEGVCYSHPDLAPNMWINEAEANGAEGKDDDGNGYIDDVYGYNFVTNGEISWDGDKDTGHGTHIAGTVAAANNNSIGVCGLAGGTGNNDGARLMSCQIFSNDIGGSTSIIARAIQYAADNGASIIQCSFGFDSKKIVSDAAYESSQSIEYAAIQYFKDTRNCDVIDGGLAIFAAGNDGSPMSSYPGAHNSVISVTSIASDNLPAYYTNYGPGSNIAAPGGEYYTGGIVREEATVLSTFPLNISSSGYGYMQGTSMACPHVSGMAALGLAYMKKLGRHCTVKEFESMLLTSVNDIDGMLNGEKTTLVGSSLGPWEISGHRKNMGTGTADIWKLMMQIEGTPSIVIKTGEEQRINLSSYFGGGASNLTYLGAEMTKEDMDAIGITALPEVRYGRLVIKPTKTGCAKITIKAIGGGDSLGGGDAVGGSEISKTVSVIARGVKSSNGGWL